MTEFAERYSRLAAHAGFPFEWPWQDVRLERYTSACPRTLLRHGFLQECLDRFCVPPASARILWDALDAVERDKQLLEFSDFLVRVMCDARWRYDGDDLRPYKPVCLGSERDAYPLLLLLACVEPSMERLRARGVPAEHYQEIPFQPMRSQFEKLMAGSVEVSDFPWDLNFYTCSIYRFDRFLFIPARMSEPLRFFRSADGHTVALYEGGYAFRHDGQLNGAGGVWDEEEAFVSRWSETPRDWEGTPVDPAGFASPKPVRLEKDEWMPVLRRGDGMLALHVPSGEGYTPERMRGSIQLALEFFARWFPEIEIRGVWSMSWLYDPHLRVAMNGSDCNILRVQAQMYLYPTQAGDDMLYMELFGGRTDPLPRGTTLQRAVADALAQKIPFCTTSMVILRADIEAIGRMPYQSEAGWRQFEAGVQSTRKIQEEKT